MTDIAALRALLAEAGKRDREWRDVKFERPARASFWEYEAGQDRSALLDALPALLDVAEAARAYRRAVMDGMAESEGLERWALLDSALDRLEALP